MAISDFFRALSSPDVQRQLAAVAYAYGPQKWNNSAASRFATYSAYRDKQADQDLERQFKEEELLAMRQAAALQKERLEREAKAKAKLEESMRGAALVSSLPSLGADLQGQGPTHGAAAPTSALIPSLAQYYADTGNYGESISLRGQMEAEEAQQQQAARKEALLEKTLADPTVQQRLGGAAEYLLRAGGPGLAKILAPPPVPPPSVGGAGGSAQGAMPDNPFGNTDTGRLRNILYTLEPKYRAGTLTPEEARLFALANESLNAAMTTTDPLRGGTLQKGNVLEAMGRSLPPPDQAQPPQGTGQASATDIPPIRGKSLAQVLENVTGPGNIIQRTLAQVPIPVPYRDAPGNMEAVEAGDYADNLRQDISVRLQKNPNFPEKQRLAIEEQIVKLKPKIYSNAKVYRQHLIGTARYVAERLDEARSSLNKDLSKKDRANAMAEVAELPYVLQKMGVYFANSPEELDAARARATPGSLIVVTDSDGTTKTFTFKGGAGGKLAQ